jgi:hypothetical protein
MGFKFHRPKFRHPSPSKLAPFHNPLAPAGKTPAQVQEGMARTLPIAGATFHAITENVKPISVIPSLAPSLKYVPHR